MLLNEKTVLIPKVRGNAVVPLRIEKHRVHHGLRFAFNPRPSNQ